MRTLVALVLAVVLAYILVGLLWWLVFNLWWLAISAAKLLFVAIVALPLYIIIRRRFLRS